MKRLLHQAILLLLPFFLGGIGLAILSFYLCPSAAQAAYIGANSLIWPISGSSVPDTDRISSPFGPRWQASQQRFDYHPGLDIVAPISTTVHAITDGVVTTVGWLSPSSGLTVIISHTQAGYNSAYLHLNSTPVITGEEVSQGDAIGYVGDSGSTEFVHLHFEIRLGDHNYPGNTRNPMGYLPHPDISAPSIEITGLDNSLVYSPVVTLSVTAARSELDVNQLRVILQDRATGELLDDQWVNFNLREHTGNDNLDQDGIRLMPSRFNASTPEYQLGATFYQLRGLDSYTLTAQVSDVAGNSATTYVIGADTTPPGKVKDLRLSDNGGARYTLTWTAPGDSGYLGNAKSYEFRYYHLPLNNSNWDQAALLADPPVPLPAGTLQSWEITGSWIGEVYIALKSNDAEGNPSVISNSVGDYLHIFSPLIFR